MSGDCSDVAPEGKPSPPLSLGQRLLDAKFPHHVQQTQLLETHISWVILTGPFAYKIKKPLRLDFLDYSTPEKRKYYCDRELAINRAWADTIYRGVVPIFEYDGRLRVGTADDTCRDGETIVDFAVWMNQFPQSALLAEQLKTAAITPALIESLGESIAHLHERLPSVPYHETLVRDGAIDPAIENCDYLLSELGPGDVDRERVTRIKQWTLHAMDRLRPLMEQRAQAGHIKTCHGDLHLGNLLYWDGQFIPFDGIEFNDAFAQVEGLDEIAFLAMELSEHGYQPHARRLLNRYVESTGDYESLKLLRYFLVYRAMVRAKVDMIRQTQQPRSAAETGNTVSARLSADGRRYLDYAERITARSTPELWITYGLSGSGKSTAAGRLVERQDSFRVRSDVQRKRLANRNPLDRTNESDLPELYNANMTQATYRQLLAIADLVLQSGYSVILDAAFLQHTLREPFEQLAMEHGVPYRILVCDAAPDELRLRLQQRVNDPSDADVSVLERQLELAQPPAGRELDFVVNASAML